jgi:hypothetical protein
VWGRRFAQDEQIISAKQPKTALMCVPSRLSIDTAQYHQNGRFSIGSICWLVFSLLGVVGRRLCRVRKPCFLCPSQQRKDAVGILKRLETFLQERPGHAAVRTGDGSSENDDDEEEEEEEEELLSPTPEALLLSWLLLL